MHSLTPQQATWNALAFAVQDPCRNLQQDFGRKEVCHFLDSLLTLQQDASNALAFATQLEGTSCLC
jgi:spore cortex formation protein SpoVR/YcgB (stage V sporulation)